MSTNDYVHYVSQKYRVAVAIAILKSKPTELTVNQYVEVLKNKLIETMDVDAISINSNDFNFDEEVVIEFNQSLNGANENDNSRNESNDCASVLDDLGVQKTNDCLLGCDEISNVLDVLRHKKQQDPSLLSRHNCTQSTYCEELEYNAPNNDNNSACTLQKSNVIHKEIPYFNHTDDLQDNTMTNKLKNSEMAHKVAKNISKQMQNTKNNRNEGKNCRNSDNNLRNNIFNNNDANNMNSDGNEITMNETVPFYTKDVNEKLLSKVRKNIIKDSSNERFENDNQHTYYDDVKIAKFTNMNINTKEKNNDNTINCEKNVTDTQKTIIYTLYDITDSDTHISQSQFDNIEIRQNFVYGNKLISNKHGGNLQSICQENIANEKDFEMNVQDRQSIIENGQNIEDDINGLQDIVENKNSEQEVDIQVQNGNNVQNGEMQVQKENNFQNEEIPVQNVNKMEITQMQCTEIDYIIDRKGKRYKLLQNFPTNKQNSYEWTLIENSQDSNTNDTIREQEIEKNKTGITEIQDGNIDKKHNNILVVHKDSEKELIPFKVVEELNKVKNYLNKRLDKKEDGYLTDSGYRSDSHSRSSFKSVQLSQNWLNQSAYSLFAHLAQCPLVAATDDITKEISQVIGNLIDKLHEEEKYPSFLEDILQTIERLLEDIFKGNSCSEIVIMNKEENFQRLCLLNRSIHTLNYTIDKVTQILEAVHTNLMNAENLYEIMNIEEVENLTYIFHIIETLVPEYMMLKNRNLGQIQSQEDKILKKSSVTEIWRKKWNPNLKEEKHFEGSCEKKCTLTKLAQILNKIVVNCIDGYSLLAFAALQSYNLMQK